MGEKGLVSFIEIRDSETGVDSHGNGLGVTWFACEVTIIGYVTKTCMKTVKFVQQILQHLEQRPTSRADTNCNGRSAVFISGIFDSRS